MISESLSPQHGFKHLSNLW